MNVITALVRITFNKQPWLWLTLPLGWIWVSAAILKHMDPLNSYMIPTVITILTILVGLLWLALQKMGLME